MLNEEPGVKQCFNCEWCIYQDITEELYCSLRNEQTKLTNRCKDYDYCETEIIMRYA